MAIDLFNAGYYWEAPEELDKLLKVSDPGKTPSADSSRVSSNWPRPD
ncbi:MAG: hypothetical protein CM1200mP2_36400 [Planctomycetaceae bacterium]|nr:MAG: hypothetical protein CM1200mP2_36400 [Planctomycetaceae bacterium]